MRVPPTRTLCETEAYHIFMSDYPRSRAYTLLHKRGFLPHYGVKNAVKGGCYESKTTDEGRGITNDSYVGVVVSVSLYCVSGSKNGQANRR